jgi:segregation and condensation protein B
MELLRQQIEALIFCSEQSISLDEIAASLKISFDWDLSDEELLSSIEEIKAKYSSDDFAFELVEISEGFQFLTKKNYHAAVSALIQHKAKKKLSVSQMETLAIIAYRQPISKSEIEHIRGVSCDYAVQKLLEKELVEISGKSDGPGRPVLYSTSKTFMDYFGIKSVKDLPQLKDLHVEQNEIGLPMEGTVEETFDSAHIHNEPESEISGEAEAEEAIIDLENEEQEFMDSDEATINFRNTDEVNADAIESSDLYDLPDRKSIFIENERLEEEEQQKSEEENKDDVH